MSTKVHKDNKDKTPCGIPCWKYAKRAKKWKNVTCRSCLTSKDYYSRKSFNHSTMAAQDPDELWNKERYEKEKSIYQYDNKKSLSENEQELNKKFPLVDNFDEVFDGTTEKEKKIPFDKWEEWFKLCCDHSFSPQPDEVWDGAIETICAYLRNELCSSLGLGEADRILGKAKKRFKTE